VSVERDGLLRATLSLDNPSFQPAYWNGWHLCMQASYPACLRTP
jgi:hypothetical protein